MGKERHSPTSPEETEAMMRNNRAESDRRLRECGAKLIAHPIAGETESKIYPIAGEKPRITLRITEEQLRNAKCEMMTEKLHPENIRLAFKNREPIEVKVKRIKTGEIEDGWLVTGCHEGDMVTVYKKTDMLRKRVPLKDLIKWNTE